MALREVTIDTDGTSGDYASMSACEAGEISGGHGNRVTADGIERIWCQATTGVADTTVVSFSTSWTTDATRYVEIISAAGHRHDGKWDTGAYRMETTDTGISLPDNGPDYIRIIGLQSKLTFSAAANAFCISSVNAQGLLIVDGCILRGVLSGSASVCCGFRKTASGGDIIVRNNIIYDFIGGANLGRGVSATSQGTHTFDNNTIQNCNRGFVEGAISTLPQTWRNNIVQNCADPYSIPAGRTYDHNNLDSGTPPGTNPVTYTCVFVNKTGDDFHLTATDLANLAGADLSSVFTLDIDGDTRVNWAIGADDGPTAGDDMVASGTGTSAGTVALTAPSPIVAAGTGTSAGTAALNSPGAMAASGTGTSAGTVGMTLVMPIIAAGTGTSVGTAEMAAIGVMVAAGTGVATGTAVMTAPAAIIASGTGRATGTVEFTVEGESSLVADIYYWFGDAETEVFLRGDAQDTVRWRGDAQTVWSLP